MGFSNAEMGLVQQSTPLQDVVGILGPFGVFGVITLVFLGLFLISLPNRERSRTEPKPTVSLPDGERSRTEPKPTVEARDVRRHYRAMPYEEYLQTPHWKRLREEKLRNVGYRCQLCGRRARILEVHHCTYERLGQELDTDLTVLCRACHSTFHKHRRLGR